MGTALILDWLTRFSLTESIRELSTIEVGWKLGLIAGVAYHFICDHPRQVDVVTSLYTFGAFDAIFLSMVLHSRENGFGEIGLAFVTFNLMQVFPAHRH
jgi:hypothetical protein